MLQQRCNKLKLFFLLLHNKNLQICENADI